MDTNTHAHITLVMISIVFVTMELMVMMRIIVFNMVGDDGDDDKLDVK